MTPPSKLRLDQLLCDRMAITKEKAQALVLSGSVWSGDERLDKPGHKISIYQDLEIRGSMQKFVGRGGDKLQFALDDFAISVQDRICMDIGASTGGFTDCLLKNGARHVISVDVGFGQLDNSLRKRKNVTCLERQNARYLTLKLLQSRFESAKGISLITVDVSFISLMKLLKPLSTEFSFIRDWVLLYKPQFEVGPKQLRRGGIVKTATATQLALDEFLSQVQAIGYRLQHGPKSSPLLGKKSGNMEYFVHCELW